MDNKVYNKLKGLVEKGYVYKNYDLTNFNTYRIKSKAKVCVLINSIETFCKTMVVCQDFGIKPIILGAGSNVILASKIIDGVVMIMSEKLNRMYNLSTSIIVEAGARLGDVIAYAKSLNLSGLESLVGIPASVGGAVYMNASAYGGDIGSKVKSVLVYSNGKIKLLNAKDISFGYRYSNINDSGDIILRVELKLNRAKKKDIENKIKEIISLRTSSVKSNYPNAGSVFKNGNNYYAGELIDKCGLKNYNIGNAYVSNFHANFIENRGAMTASDVISLIEYIKKVVLDKFGVELMLEQKILGEDKNGFR